MQTGSMSVLISGLTSRVDPEAVLMAVAVTVFMTIAITLFTWLVSIIHIILIRQDL